MEGFFGYCGRYEIDSSSHTIYHYPEVAMDPNFVGTKQRRPYTLDDGMLTFSDKDTTPGVASYAITWQKKTKWIQWLSRENRHLDRLRNSGGDIAVGPAD